MYVLEYILFSIIFFCACFFSEQMKFFYFFCALFYMKKTQSFGLLIIRIAACFILLVIFFCTIFYIRTRIVTLNARGKSCDADFFYFACCEQSTRDQAHVGILKTKFSLIKLTVKTLISHGTHISYFSIKT